MRGHIPEMPEMSSTCAERDQPGKRQRDVEQEEDGDRPGETVLAEQVHADADRLRTEDHAEAVAEDEGGVGRGQLVLPESRVPRWARPIV